MGNSTSCRRGGQREPQISTQMYLEPHFNMNFQFWAVLGSRLCFFDLKYPKNEFSNYTVKT
jgi:hypothetical protein